MTDSTNVLLTDPTQVSRVRKAYDAHIGEIRALPASDLVQMNIDVAVAITTSLGAQPELRALQPRLAKLPEYQIERVNNLEGYTLATAHAQGLYMVAGGSPEFLQATYQQSIEERDKLIANATVLVKYKLLPAHMLKDLSGSIGYRNVALDMIALASGHRAYLAQIAGKTAVDAAQLDLVETLADRLLTGAGLKDQAPPVVAEAAQDRHRAFSLMMNAYEEARRGVAFLRFHQGDVDTILPSLYAAARTPAKSKVGVEKPEAPVTGQAPVDAPVKIGSKVPVGHPDSSPFIDEA